jgi:hypothetical protein
MGAGNASFPSPSFEPNTAKLGLAKWLASLAVVHRAVSGDFDQSLKFRKVAHLTSLQMPSHARPSEMAVMPALLLRMPNREPLARILALCCSSWDCPEM